MPRATGRPVLVTGATGFVGRALLPVLVSAGWRVRATTRRHRPGASAPRGAGQKIDWREVDLSRAQGLPAVLDGIDTAWFLVHGMASGRGDYAREERRSAAAFAKAAHLAGVRRIVYLGGVAPRGPASRHLASRLAVGEVLRAGPVPAFELRASMIIGAGSASWQVVRDLALRLPAMVLPAWAATRTCPVGIDDVVAALAAAPGLEPAHGLVHDLPGADELTVREILERTAALRGRALPALQAPFPIPAISTLWLKLVSDADWHVVRELVQGLAHDLLPRDRGFWARAGLRPPLGFDEAARRALAGDRPAQGLRGAILAAAEAVVARVGPRARGDRLPRPPGHAITRHP